jgi:hypothetical protein
MDENMARNCMQAVRSALQALAREKQIPPRELACTFLMVVVRDGKTLALQVGDGGIALDFSGKLELFEVPRSTGEYANETNFVTDAKLKVHTELFSSAPSRIAVFSDGVEFLGVHLKTRAVQESFFAPFFSTLINESAVTDRFNVALADFLANDSVSEKTDDDKTLALAIDVETYRPPASAAVGKTETVPPPVSRDGAAPVAKKTGASPDVGPTAKKRTVPKENQNDRAQTVLPKAAAPTVQGRGQGKYAMHRIGIVFLVIFGVLLIFLYLGYRLAMNTGGGDQRSDAKIDKNPPPKSSAAPVNPSEKDAPKNQAAPVINAPVPREEPKEEVPPAEKSDGAGEGAAPSASPAAAVPASPSDGAAVAQDAKTGGNTGEKAHSSQASPPAVNHATPEKNEKKRAMADKKRH